MESYSMRPFEVSLFFLTQQNSLDVHPAVDCIKSLFLFLSNHYSIVWMYHRLIEYSPAEGHFGCFGHYT